MRSVQSARLFRSATARVLALSLFLVGAGTAMAIVATSLSGQLHPPFTIPWWAFAPAIMAAEGLMFHIERKTETHSFNLSEIPLVVGFFFASPWAVIAGRLVGQLAYRLIVRRQAPIKIIFNLSSFWAETAVAMCLFRALAAHTSPLSPTAWVAILLAVLTADLASMVAVTSVIRWTGGESQLQSVLITGLVTAGINTVLSILAAIILWASPWAFLLLCLVIVSFTVLYGRHLALSQRYSGLQMLYGFTQMVGASLKAEAVTEEVLAEARKLLRSGRAEIVLLDEQSGSCAYRLVSQDGEGQILAEALEVPALQEEPVWNDVIARQNPTLIARGTRNAAQLSFLNRVGAADCMIAPLVSEEKIVGTIMVADRQSNLTSFDNADLKLFATLANHASVAFENGRLVERLRKEAEERRHEALHDSLTGLPNRTLFVERVAALRESGSNREAAVMLMDLDRFKEVNDTLGHHNGDLLLQEVAARLVDSLRSCDTVARLGGDEFAILLPGAGSTEQVMTSAARIVDALEHPFQLEGLRVDIGASIGVASYPEHGQDAATLLQRADVAMYQAKSGEGPIVLYAPESDHNTPERLTLATDLRHAMTDDQIEIYYQPKARLSDGSVIGVEALLRWNHPTRGRIGPAEFIPVAEQSGLITPLTMRILRSALTHLKEWNRAGYELHVSVNLALRSLLDTDMPSQVEALLLEIGVPSDRLTLEITESSVMADPPRTIAVLERLAALGVRLSVDDFGTGYSSLSYLRRLPVNEVKIDQAFVLRMASEPTDAAVVRSIIELSHNLGLSTVAEGVEDAVSWEMLRQMGCDEVQGYHLSRPMHSSSFGRWLSTIQRPAPRPAPPVHVAAAAAKSVLVVDDDWLVRDLVSHLLDDAGSYEVHEASDGWEAIAQARLHQPDVIILDLAMPRMDGLDALPNIRAVAPKSRVVVLSSTDDRRLAAITVERGATAFVDKALGLDLIPEQVALALAS